MRSLVVTTWFPDASAPSRTPFCLEHVLAVQSAGYDTHVVHVALGRERAPVHIEMFEGVRVTRVRLNPRSPASLASTTCLIARELRQSDIVHTMAFSSVLVTALAWLLVRRPWLHTEHWNGVTSPSSVAGLWPRVAMLRHALRLPHHVTGVTSDLARQMSRFTRRDATSVVPCVVHPQPLAPFPSQPPLRIVGVALLIPRKRPDLALETIAWLREQGVDVCFTWVGGGPLLTEMQSRSVALGLADCVSFTGAVPPDEVPAHLADAHLFFVPSEQENFFTAAAESISAGRPVVLPLSGGFDDYCTLSNSVLVNRWDAELLGRAILDASERFATTSPEKIAHTIGDRFTADRVGQQFSALYSEMATPQ